MDRALLHIAIRHPTVLCCFHFSCIICRSMGGVQPHSKPNFKHLPRKYLRCFSFRYGYNMWWDFFSFFSDLGQNICLIRLRREGRKTIRSILYKGVKIHVLPSTQKMTLTKKNLIHVCHKVCLFHIGKMWVPWSDTCLVRFTETILLVTCSLRNPSYFIVGGGGRSPHHPVM